MLSQSWNVGLTSSWEINLWGKTRRSIQTSEPELGAAEAELAATRLEILADVADSYVDLRTAQARIVYAENAVKGYRDTLVLPEPRKAGGLLADTEVVKAEASLASAEAQVPPLRADAARARRRLAVLTGRNPRELETRFSTRGSPCRRSAEKSPPAYLPICFAGAPT